VKTRLQQTDFISASTDRYNGSVCTENTEKTGGQDEVGRYMSSSIELSEEPAIIISIIYKYDLMGFLLQITAILDVYVSV
jgi:hypothetical protein